MKKNLALVLSGGGSKGALQVGALRALCELGVQPDLLVGASIGAVNASFLAMHGFNQGSLDALTGRWEQIKDQNLLPKNYIWQAVRALVRRSAFAPAQAIREFLIRQGFTEDLCFGDLHHQPLVIVSADLNTGAPILHGLQPDEKVLDAMLLSTALPPWSMPVKRQGRYLMDGGVVSNLPVEPALQAGAQEIIALDLMDMRSTPGMENGLGQLVDRLSAAVEKRHADLELLLAAARGIWVHYIPLVSDRPIPYWDFQHTSELIDQGYQKAKQEMNTWQIAQTEANGKWLPPITEKKHECTVELTA